MAKTVFITGASRGIGESLALRYARPGNTLGLLCKSNFDQLEEVARRCRERGTNVFIYQADVADESGLRSKIDDFKSRVGTIDVVIANAGIAVTEDESYSNSQVALVNMQVNYLGLINTLHPFVERMITQRNGRLVAISSISSIRSTQNSGAYSASKAAVNLWTEGLRLRLFSTGVSVTTIRVGFVDTGMTSKLPFKAPGMISAERSAELIESAIEARKRLVTLPWRPTLMWRVFGVIPGFAYDYLITWAKSYQVNRLGRNR